MMQNILAGAALGSIITALIGLAWHRAAVESLVEQVRDYKGAYAAVGSRLNRIKTQFKDGKSGTAKLAVKIARGEVA